MDNFNSAGLSLNVLLNGSRQRKILNYIKENPSREGDLAKKARKRLITIALLICLLIIPIAIFFVFSVSGINTKSDETVKDGRVSLEETFWYTEEDLTRHEFPLADYANGETYKPGDRIYIYTDGNNNVLSISHRDNNQNSQNLVSLSVSLLLVPIIMLLLHVFISRKTYCKDWFLYDQWYRHEIEPYIHLENYKEAIKGKKYYDVTIDLKKLSNQDQLLYKKYKSRNIIYVTLELICVLITIYVCVEYYLSPLDWRILLPTVLYLLIFGFLTDDCSNRIFEITKRYHNNQE